jgi:hypothetical protein
VTSRRLFGVFGGPVAWTLHLLASYAIVVMGCSTRGDDTALALVAITVGCAAASVGSGVGVILLAGAVPAMVPLC